MATFNRAPSRTFHDHHHTDTAAAGLPTIPTSSGTLALLLAGSLLLTIASVFQNGLFASSISQEMIPASVMIMLFVGFNLIEIALPTIIRQMWNQGRFILCALLSIGFVCAALASFVAGSSFYADQVERTQNARMQASPEFTQAQDAVAGLQAEVSALAVAPAAAIAAQATIDKLNEKKSAILRKNSFFMNEDYSPKGRWSLRTEKAVKVELTPLDNAIARQQSIIDQAALYNAKRYELKQAQADVP
ncbi:MAG: hypothetical protein R8K20_00595, partial [Gallionellaceae bacterium]